MPKILKTYVSPRLFLYFIFYQSGMNQTQFEINLGQAEKEFSEIVGACFVWLRANTTKTELEILSGLQISLAEVIEEVKEKEARLN